MTMHNREITHIVKTDNRSKPQLIVRNNVNVGVIREKLLSKLKQKNKKARFETLNIHII